MSHKKKILTAALAALCMAAMLFVSIHPAKPVYASLGYEFILLDKHFQTLKIGDECYLTAITSTGKKPSFSSSKSSVASVNTYGKITAKKAGAAVITAKIKGGEASCRIIVEKTAVELNSKSITLENGGCTKLKASSSTGHPVTFKSSKSSVASVDETGLVTAKKIGTATITATVDKTSESCKIIVKEPDLKLNKSSVSLFRKETVKLSLTSTSKITPKWKTSKKSVATVDSDGTVTAIKNGTATITAAVDGVSKTCKITVKKPKITFETDHVTLAAGEEYQAKATVSSNNKPEFSSSNTNVASVSESGKIIAKAPGKAYIYAKEDGVKERMTVNVTKNN